MSIGKFFLSVAALRKILTCLVVVVLFSCSKKSKGDYCWSCEVTGPGYYRQVDTCTEDARNNPQFEDANGNDLNAFCTRR